MFTKIVKYSLVTLLAIFLLIQLKRPEKNISVTSENTTFATAYKVPEQVNTVLSNSCYDCHSNNTKYPWYSEVQPMASLMEEHIVDGKEKLNFDELSSYGPRRTKSKFKQIINQIQQNKMPLESYTLMHQSTALSKEEQQLLVDYFNSLIQLQ